MSRQEVASGRTGGLERMAAVSEADRGRSLDPAGPGRHAPQATSSPGPAALGHFTGFRMAGPAAMYAAAARSPIGRPWVTSAPRATAATQPAGSWSAPSPRRPKAIAHPRAEAPMVTIGRRDRT
jgi:hypothetical protein